MDVHGIISYIRKDEQNLKEWISCKYSNLKEK